MRLAVLLSLLLGAPASAQQAAKPGPEVRQEQRAELTLTAHARQRMAQRGVTEAQVRAAVEKGEKFKYFHEGKWKTGYYDEKARLFLATADGVLITVITNATPGYIARLKRKKP